MIKTIRKIKQTCRNIMVRYRKIKNEIQRQRILSKMEKVGIVVLENF